MYRQGDVLFIPVKNKIKITEDMLRETERRDKNRVVIEYGEVTGHAHAFYTPETVEVVNPTAGQRILNVLKESELKHEEHSTIKFPEGQYEIRRQREFDPIQERLIAD